MPRVLDSFFCFSLHTGTVVLGWFGFTSAFLSIIGWSMNFNNIDEYIKRTFNGTDLPDPDKMTPQDLDFLRDAAVASIAIMIGFYVIECIASLFIVVGASNNKRLYLVPWLIERACQLLFFTVMVIIFALFFITNVKTFAVSLSVVIIGGLIFIFHLYCFLCVYSLYHLILEMEQHQPLLAPGISNPNYSGTTYVKIT
jgi:hypothetical protein